MVRKGTTYANVTSTIALVIALGGTSAYAAGKITSADIKDGTIKAADLAKGAVTSAKIRDGNVRTPDIAGSAVTTGKVKDGTLRVQDFAAGTLTGQAFAMVHHNDGTGDVEFTTTPRGFTGVTEPSVGTYCLTPAPGVDVEDANAIASPEWYDSSGTDLFVEPLRTVSSCPDGTLEVLTYTFAGLTDNLMLLSDNVAFSVFLP
jgi:hypothetical protein